MTRWRLAISILVIAACADPPMAPPHANVTTDPRASLALGAEVKGRIVFFKEGDLFSMDPDGTGLTELTLGLSGGHHPVWSPKGGRVIALSDNRFGSDDIFVMKTKTAPA